MDISRLRNKEVLIVGCILFLALILRILALISFKNSLYSDFLLWDEAIYHSLASKIATGTYNSKSVYEFAPLPAYLFAGIYKLFSIDSDCIRYLNIFLGTFTCFLIFQIGKLGFSQTIGYASCLIACLYKPFIFYNIVPLKTSLSLFLFSLTIFLFLLCFKNPTFLKFGLLGLLAGLMLNTRGNFAVVVPFLPLILLPVLLKKGMNLRKKSVLVTSYFLGLIIVISPFMVRNYLVSNEIAITTSQAGQNLYYGNNPDSKVPYFRPLPFAHPSPFVQGIQFTIEASRKSEITLSHQESSGFWIKEVLLSAIHKPLTFIEKVGLKILALVNRFEPGLNYNINFLKEFIPFFKISFLEFWMILPFGVLGLALSVPYSDSIRSICLIAFLYVTSLIIFYTTTTYRLPLLILLIPFATVGITGFWDKISSKSHKKVIFHSSIILLVIAVEHLPIRGSNDLSAYYNTHAIVLESRGRSREADKFWKKSSDINQDFSLFARLSLASRAISTQNFDKATEYLDDISGTSIAAAGKYDVQGDLHLNKKQVGRAIVAYRKSLEINSGQRKVMKKLIKIFQLTNQKELMLQEQIKLRKISKYYDLM